MSARPPQLLVTIDVEPDRQWEAEPVSSLDNLSALPQLQARLEAAGARPTYLVTHSVCDHGPAVELLARLCQEHRCEVGAHLHSWETPPLTDSDAAGGPKPFPSELARDVLQAKLARLTEVIESRVGPRPRSYRAGRWGLDGQGLRVLEQLGYRVDSSVTPLLSWAGHPGRRPGSCGPCFKTAPRRPYYPDHADVCRPGMSSVLEVPVSTGFVRPVGRRLLRWYQAAPERSRWLRVLRKVGPLRVTWLRPTFASAAEMIRLGERLLTSGAPVLNMCFHSSEALPGGSPYFPTQAEVEAFLQRIEATVAHLVGDRGVEAATLREVTPPPAGAEEAR